MDYAIEREQGTEERIRELRQASADTLHVWYPEIREDHRPIIRDRSHYVVPAYNEGETIQRVLRYLVHEHEIDSRKITVLNNSTDPHDQTREVSKKFGVEPVEMDRVFSALLDTPKFLDLLQSETVPRGKGLALTAAFMHLLHEGIIQRANERRDHVVMLDADPQDYGVGKYDPVTNFAEMRRLYGAESMKPAKINRNNQPVYVGENAIGIMGLHAKDTLDYNGMMQWRLTGEMSRVGRAIPNTVLSTGYPVETTMNISDGEQGLLFKQYADGHLRSDGHNPLEKETGMYSQILRTRIAIEMWNSVNIQLHAARLHHDLSARDAVRHIMRNSYKRTIDYDADDVRGVNEILAQEIFEYIPRETLNPKSSFEKGEKRQLTGVQVVDLKEARLIGNIRMLVREGIVRGINLW